MSNRAPFITDLGQQTERRDAQNRLHQILPRYGVWAWDAARGPRQVVATGDDLAPLRQEYHIPADRVYRLRNTP